MRLDFAEWLLCLLFGCLDAYGEQAFFGVKVGLVSLFRVVIFLGLICSTALLLVTRVDLATVLFTLDLEHLEL